MGLLRTDYAKLYLYDPMLELSNGNNRRKTGMKYRENGRPSRPTTAFAVYFASAVRSSIKVRIGAAVACLFK